LRLRRCDALAKTIADSQCEGNDMASDNDIKAHQQTYGSVMTMLKWGTVASALVGALVILLIST